MKTREARSGGFEVDLAWKAGRVTEATVRSHLGGNCRIVSAVPLAGRGVTRRPATGANPNSSFRPVPAGKAVIAPGVVLPRFEAAPAAAVEFATSKSQSVTLTAVTRP